MTRKNYIVLAAAICQSANKAQASESCTATKAEAALYMAQEIASQIGNVLAADNPRFDWARWMNACNTGA